MSALANPAEPALASYFALWTCRECGYNGHGACRCGYLPTAAQAFNPDLLETIHILHAARAALVTANWSATSQPAPDRAAADHAHRTTYETLHANLNRDLLALAQKSAP